MGQIGEIFALAGLHVDRSSFNEFSSGLRTANQGIEETSAGMKALNAMAFTGIAAGIGAIGSAGIDMASKFQGGVTVLETLYGNMGRAKEEFAWLQDFAAKTPFEFPELLDATVKLKAYGIEAQDVMTTIGDTASAMHKPINMAVEAVADAMTGEFERLKEFGIKAVQVNKDNFATLGVSADAAGKTALTYMDKNGQQMAQVVDRNNRQMTESTILAIWNERYAGGMDKLSKTWEGTISNLKDSVGRGLAGIMGFDSKDAEVRALSIMGVLQRVALGVTAVMNAFNGMGAPVQTAVAAFGALVAAGALLMAGMIGIPALFGLLGTAATLSIPPVLGLGTAISLSMWQVTAIAAVVAIVVGALVLFNEKTGLLTAAWNQLCNAFTLGQAIFNVLQPVFMQFFNFLSGNVVNSITAITDAWNTLSESFSDLSLTDTLQEAWDSVLEGIDEFISDVQDYLDDAYEWVTDKWNDFKESFNLDNVKNPFDTVKGYFDTFKTDMDSFYTAEGDVIRRIAAAFGFTIPNPWTTIKGYFDTFMTFLRGLPATIATDIRNIASSFGITLTNPFEGVSGWVTPFSNLKNAIGEEYNKIKGRQDQAEYDTKDWAIKTADDLQAAITGYKDLDSAASGANNSVEKITKHIEEIKKKNEEIAYLRSQGINPYIFGEENIEKMAGGEGVEVRGNDNEIDPATGKPKGLYTGVIGKGANETLMMEKVYDAGGNSSIPVHDLKDPTSVKMGDKKYSIQPFVKESTEDRIDETNNKLTNTSEIVMGINKSTAEGTQLLHEREQATKAAFDPSAPRHDREAVTELNETTSTGTKNLTEFRDVAASVNSTPMDMILGNYNALDTSSKKVTEETGNTKGGIELVNNTSLANVQSEHTTLWDRIKNVIFGSDDAKKGLEAENEVSQSNQHSQQQTTFDKLFNNNSIASVFGISLGDVNNTSMGTQIGSQGSLGTSLDTSKTKSGLLQTGLGLVNMVPMALIIGGVSGIGTSADTGTGKVGILRGAIEALNFISLSGIWNTLSTLYSYAKEVYNYISDNKDSGSNKVANTTKNNNTTNINSQTNNYGSSQGYNFNPVRIATQGL